jgi:hypothetical protein
MDIEEKKKKCDYLIDNSKSIEELEKEVDRVHLEIKKFIPIYFSIRNNLILFFIFVSLFFGREFLKSKI